jgi:hypothetical protein
MVRATIAISRTRVSFKSIHASAVPSVLVLLVWLVGVGNKSARLLAFSDIPSMTTSNPTTINKTLRSQPYCDTQPSSYNWVNHRAFKKWPCLHYHYEKQLRITMGKPIANHYDKLLFKTRLHHRYIVRD